MMRAPTTGRRVGQLVLLACLAGAAALHAQDNCDALVARASNEFDTARRLQLLTAAVDPATCPPRGSWTIAIQLLAQTLIEDHQDSLAAVWLRWGARLAPDMQPDTVQFLPRVVQAFRAARDFARRTSVRGDSAVTTTWQWPPPGQAVGRQGRLQVVSAAIPLRVDVPGIGAIPPSGLSLAPASYQLSATAVGSDSVRFTREVLPGVATVLDIRLRSTLALQPPPPPPGAPSHKKKKFPVLWVAGGAVALGAVALLAGGGGGGGTQTGGITLIFPNP